MAKTFEEIQKENEEWARQHPEASHAGPHSSSDESYGLLNHSRDVTTKASGAVHRIWNVISAIIRPVAAVVFFVAPFVEPCARGLYKIAMTRPGADGKRHFAPKRAAISLIIAFCLAVASPFLAMGAYYYGTLRDIDNVYIPDAAVFVNQQFERANDAGRHITSRDEIYTVMGRWQQPNGEVDPVRFDIDTNAYFPQYSATMRPDLAAAKLNSESPYGVRAKLKVTGFYSMLPRFIRFEVVKWFNLRVEIVDVLDVKELTTMPSFAKTIDGAGMSTTGLPDPAAKPLSPLPPQNQDSVPSSPAQKP